MKNMPASLSKTLFEVALGVDIRCRMKGAETAEKDEPAVNIQFWWWMNVDCIKRFPVEVSGPLGISANSMVRTYRMKK